MIYNFSEANQLPMLMLIVLVNVSPNHTEHAKTLAWTLRQLLDLQSLPANIEVRMG